VRDSTNGDFLAPAEILSQLASRVITYYITSGANWAVGKGLLSSDGLTLTRDPNECRWNGSTFAAGLLSLTGASTVFIAPDSSDLSASDLGRTLAARVGAHLC